jgi:hypothetical protein
MNIITSVRKLSLTKFELDVGKSMAIDAVVSPFLISLENVSAETNYTI